MTLYTTYLAFLKKGVAWINGKPGAIHVNDTFEKAEFVYVMRNRGNNEVAPITPGLIEAAKAKRWDLYKRLYLERLYSRRAVRWMKEVGERAKTKNVVFVCYEKDAEHCHRTLLAQNVAKWSGCEYGGDLTK